MKIILIDNYDSFTFNLYHYISSLKTHVDVVRNDKITDKEIIDSFSDTVLIVNDSYILYRKLQFSYLKDKQYYNVSILKNQSQSDSLIKKIVINN